MHIANVTVLVPDYDDAIDFYVNRLGFDLVEDTSLSPTKRWVRVSPPGSRETSILLAKAASSQQRAAIGNQSGGRVFLFLETDSFRRDYERFRNNGVTFLEDPRQEDYGTVAVFEDPYGNKWDLIESRA